MPRLDPQCSVDGCERTPTRRGLCVPHYSRWYRTGSVGSAEIAEPVLARRYCEQPGCDRPRTGRGMCQVHYSRWRRTGDPSGLSPRTQAKGAENPGWRGDSVSYSGAHRRVIRLKGAAAQHRCIQCGRQAEDWAYDHQSQVELVSPDRLTYSPEPEHYVPMCKKCHKAFDA